ncbi:hypothetical protein EBA14_02015 [Xanthomonas oryzae pv. oryzae]|nr:hypothetical protein EBA14_02015 [Xanthomonas oryzae pv. oryzae]
MRAGIGNSLFGIGVRRPLTFGDLVLRVMPNVAARMLDVARDRSGNDAKQMDHVTMQIRLQLVVNRSCTW